MFYGSGPNTTDDRRVGLVLRFVSPDVAQGVGTRDYAMTVRGVNRTSHLLPTPVPFTDFTASALALHEEITTAQAAPLDRGAHDTPSYRR